MNGSEKLGVKVTVDDEANSTSILRCSNGVFLKHANPIVTETDVIVPVLADVRAYLVLGEVNSTVYRCKGILDTSSGEAVFIIAAFTISFHFVVF